jgi:hypothetical protein
VLTAYKHPDTITDPLSNQISEVLFPTFVTSASALPQILLDSQPEHTHRTSHTRCSHHNHNHHSDHSHRACTVFIKQNGTETYYSCLKWIGHRIKQYTQKHNLLSRIPSGYTCFTTALIYYTWTKLSSLESLSFWLPLLDANCTYLASYWRSGNLQLTNNAPFLHNWLLLTIRLPTFLLSIKPTPLTINLLNVSFFLNSSLAPIHQTHQNRLICRLSKPTFS